MNDLEEEYSQLRSSVRAEVENNLRSQFQDE